MKRVFLLSILFLCCTALYAQDKLIFMPSGLPQSQAAGFFAAKEKGFYADEGLDVTIEYNGINSSKTVIDRLSNGDADIVCANPIQTLLAIADGVPIKNVMQITQTTGLMIVSHTPIDGVKSLDGKKIGIWKTGFSEICEVSCKMNDIDVQWVPFLGGINLFVSGAVDAVVAMSYNEYFSLLQAIGEIKPENVMHFGEYGYDIPEDGLYCLDSFLLSHPGSVDKFIRATKRGWDWCMENQDEALDIVMSYVEKYNVLTNRYHQKCEMLEFFNLMNNKLSGVVDYEPISQELFDALVKSLVRYNYLPRTISYKEFMR